MCNGFALSQLQYISFEDRLLGVYHSWICNGHKESNFSLKISYTVKLVYDDHPRDPEFVAVVDRWSVFRGNSML